MIITDYYLSLGYLDMNIRKMSMIEYGSVSQTNT